MNPSTAFGTVFADELARCGLREAVIAPGSRSTPLAMALHALERDGRIRLHVRIDERSASFVALGLAKASRRPVAVLCTSGTAAANFHPAVIEADESGVPLLVLTADRPPELRGTGASQTIDQVKMYGSAVRWYAEAEVPQPRQGAVAYWRSLACQAWAQAAGDAGTFPGPVHVNLPFRDPLVPDDDTTWAEPLDGRPAGAAWTVVAHGARTAPTVELPWTERGLVVCGDGDYDAQALVELAERAGWPVLAEPSSGARRGPNALTGYQYLLASKPFMAAYRPDVIVSAGRPGLSRPQSALLGLARSGEPVAARRRGAGSRPVGRPAARGDRRRGGCPPDGAAPRLARRPGRMAGAVAARRRGGACRRGRGPRGGHLRREAPLAGQLLDRAVADRAAAGPRAAGRAARSGAAVGGEQPVRSGYRSSYAAADGCPGARQQGCERAIGSLPGAPGRQPSRRVINVSSPFRLDYVVWALRRRAHNEVDRFDAGCYRRC